MVAPDGGKAFRAAAKQLGAPVLEGVQHAKRVFTPVCPASQGRAAKDHALAGRAEEARQGNGSHAAGDNAAEGIFVAMKQTMRRFGGTRSGSLTAGMP